uniref:Uncharacterized protein n=1 Tax=Leersia perrieri TaxID=77586 RepID=A0A0D9X9W0_9ORYZ
MVVLMEAESGCGGVKLKRKGDEQPDLFVFSGDLDAACRATKMRRLDAAEADDVAMGDAPSKEGEGGMVLYEPAEFDSGGDGSGLLGELLLLLRPWATLRAGGEWIRDMLREADSRTVRRLLLLSGDEEDDDSGGLALVPWGSSPPPPPPPPAAAGDSMAEVAEEEEEREGSTAAAMEVEEESGDLARSVTGAGVGCGEGYFFRRWPPQHCMPPPAMPAMIGQASPVMTWSW